MRGLPEDCPACEVGGPHYKGARCLLCRTAPRLLDAILRVKDELTGCIEVPAGPFAQPTKEARLVGILNKALEGLGFPP